jgi:hypothetical protein
VHGIGAMAFLGLVSQDHPSGKQEITEIGQFSRAGIEI